MLTNTGEKNIPSFQLIQNLFGATVKALAGRMFHTPAMTGHLTAVKILKYSSYGSKFIISYDLVECVSKDGNIVPPSFICLLSLVFYFLLKY